MTDFDLNQAYAAHQLALIDAGLSQSSSERSRILASAERIAQRIEHVQHELGARAAEGWTTARDALSHSRFMPAQTA